MSSNGHKTKVAVLGGGRLALRVTQLLQHTNQVTVWARRAENQHNLAGALKKAKVTGSLEEACHPTQVVFFAVPAHALAQVAQEYAPFARGDHVVLHACRGVGEGFVLPSTLVRQHTCVRKIGVLGGPLYFDEATRDRPMVAVLASRFDEVWETVKTLVAGTAVRVHPSHDVTGVEVAGAISNVAALACGMADALEMGETARGVLLTRGLSEGTRLGLRLGAELATFSGLAGVGDLIPRHVASTKRHRDVGGLLASGSSLEGALQSVEGCVEGVVTATQAALAAQRLKIAVPLISAVDDILHGRAKAKAALEEILRLDIELERDAVMGRA